MQLYLQLHVQLHLPEIHMLTATILRLKVLSQSFRFCMCMLLPFMTRSADLQTLTNNIVNAEQYLALMVCVSSCASGMSRGHG